MKQTVRQVTGQVTVTPSLNDLHSNRWEMTNWKKKYLKELSGYDMAYGLKKPTKTRLFISRYGNRELDIDNYHGGTKPLTDCLKELCLIWDDSPKWCEVIFLPQQKVPKIAEKTLFIIEIIEDIIDKE